MLSISLRSVAFPGKKAGFVALIIFASTLVVSGLGASEKANQRVVRGRLNYSLARGTSSFIFRLADVDQRRCFTFVNENPRAEGRLSIAVSDRPLPAGSRSWSTVRGAIPFRHKRRFALSLVGVEANYVKLTFEVSLASDLRNLD